MEAGATTLALTRQTVAETDCLRLTYSKEVKLDLGGTSALGLNP